MWISYIGGKQVLVMGWVSNKKYLQDYIHHVKLMSADESWSGKLMIDVLTCYQAMTGRG